MSESSSEKFTVVVGLEFSERGDRALSEACRLALERRGELHLVHVLDRREIDATAEKSWRDKPRQAVREAAERIWDRLARVRPDRAGEGEVLVWAHVRLGPVAREILDVATEFDGDLIVVGSEGHRGWVEELLSSSVARRVGKGASCPVLLARRKTPSSAPPPPPGPAVYESPFPDEPVVHGYDASRPVRFGPSP